MDKIYFLLLQILLSSNNNDMYGTVSRSFANFKKFARHVSDDIRNMPTYHPDYLDKAILVHFKHYPSIEAVPERVSQHVMNKVKNFIVLIASDINDHFPGEIHG